MANHNDSMTAPSRSLAAVFQSPGAMNLTHFDTPVPIGDQVLVKVLGCTLCGSDLHSYSGRRKVAVPTILGHEIVGQIVAFGPGASAIDFAGKPLAIGDRVSWAVVSDCGSCFYCEHDVPQKCVRGIKYGHQKIMPGLELTGGLAEHCLLVSGTKIVRWDAEVPLSVACPASCATATAMAALDRHHDLSSRTVLVMGAGLLGLTTCAIAASRGAKEVVCVDPMRERQQLAVEFGATASIGPDGLEDWSERQLPRGFDLAIEMSGQTTAFECAWDQLRIGGHLVLVGSVFPSPPVPMALEQIVRDCITIQGVHNYRPEHIVEAVDFLTGHHQRYPFAKVVSHWYALDQIDAALAAARNTGAIRIGVQM